MKKTAFLLLGTNLGDRKKNLSVARNTIDVEVGTIIKASSIYQTAAWGKTDQPDFLNQALKVETTLSPNGILEKILKIEQGMGRRRDEKWGERIIDIDILLYEKEIVHSLRLTLPHPQLQHRRFALEPLAEIAGTEIHPTLALTVRAMLEQCADTLKVSRTWE